MDEVFAHTFPNSGPEKWQPLTTHLENVAHEAAFAAETFGARDWGYIAGKLHDIGKFNPDFQNYLRASSHEKTEGICKVDHSTPGARYAIEAIRCFGHLLAYVIAGHHGGLPDGRSLGSCLEKRIIKSSLPLPAVGSFLEVGQIPGSLPLPLYLQKALAQRDGFAVAFFVRMLFSCLVDADFLDTERFMDPSTACQRSPGKPLTSLLSVFVESVRKLERENASHPLSELRRKIRSYCEEAAEEPPGFFSLTVPTGGGKTLSSLMFALKHAVRHGLHRVIYVAPFTTIVEQNAAVYREHLGEDVVLEHHCNISPEKETLASRLASENWDAPLIVTTAVQFYESLFSNRPSMCRKLHRMARSVIILDEAQTLPIEYLHPCLRALTLLVQAYGSTVVLCTATPPAITKRPEFEIGIDCVREILPNPAPIYQQLRRVEFRQLGTVDDKTLAELIRNYPKVLCIVNTTRHARTLFQELGKAEGHFHLSARMCPAHRRTVLDQIRHTLEKREICRVVSTQVMEAGVDIDFPVVFRAMAGLDSIVQAAGRCNRHNRLQGKGTIFLFVPDHRANYRFFSDTADCAAQVLALYPDPLSLETNEHYFRLYYWGQKARWDFYRIMDRFHVLNDRNFPFCFQFKETAENFHLIDDQSLYTVIIPWGEEGKKWCQELAAQKERPTREILRQIQRFAVQIPRGLCPEAGDLVPIFDNLGILESPEAHYNPDTGLDFEGEAATTYIV